MKNDSGKDGQQDNKDQDDNDGETKPSSCFPAVEGVLLIFANPECKRVLKVINREVNTLMPIVPKYLDWAKTPINFDQTDHQAHIPTPG